MPRYLVPEGLTLEPGEVACCRRRADPGASRALKYTAAASLPQGQAERWKAWEDEMNYVRDNALVLSPWAIGAWAGFVFGSITGCGVVCDRPEAHRQPDPCVLRSPQDGNPRP